MALWSLSGLMGLNPDLTEQRWTRLALAGRQAMERCRGTGCVWGQCTHTWAACCVPTRGQGHVGAAELAGAAPALVGVGGRAGPALSAPAPRPLGHTLCPHRLGLTGIPG